MQVPDQVLTPLTPFGELQVRMGVPPLETLLAERDELIKQVAKLRARHGSFGTWDSERKMELEKGAAIIRARAAATAEKITEARIESEKHTADAYVQWLADSLTEKATWIEMENRIQGIEDMIRRGDVVGRFATAELGLAR
jgi:chorismate mutase